MATEGLIEGCPTIRIESNSRSERVSTLLGGTGTGRERGEAPVPEGRGLHNVASLKCIHRHALGQSTDAYMSCEFPFQKTAPDSEEGRGGDLQSLVNFFVQSR